MYAIERGHLPTVEYLLTICKVSVDDYDEVRGLSSRVRASRRRHEVHYLKVGLRYHFTGAAQRPHTRVPPSIGGHFKVTAQQGRRWDTA